jgi:hypothetical protein
MANRRGRGRLIEWRHHWRPWHPQCSLCVPLNWKQVKRC